MIVEHCVRKRMETTLAVAFVALACVHKAGVIRATKLLQLATKSDFYAC